MFSQSSRTGCFAVEWDAKLRVRWCMDILHTFRFYGALAVAVSIGWFSTLALAQDGGAGALLPTLDESSAIAPYRDEFMAARDAEETGPAAACDRLRAAVRPDVAPGGDLGLGPVRFAFWKDWPRIQALVEMLDRGLCVAADPVEATRLLSEYLEAKQYQAALDLAWRYWHGFGAEQDLARAHALIRIGLIGMPERYPHDATQPQRTQLGRLLPLYANQVAGWIAERTDRSLFEFVAQVAETGVEFPDGSTVPATPNLAKSVINSRLFNNDLEANYQIGLMVRRGVFGVSAKEFWDLGVTYAAQCGHIPAIYLMARYNEQTKNEFASMKAIMRYQQLLKLGVNSIPDIDRVIESLPPSFKSFMRPEMYNDLQVPECMLEQ